jgi:hypothetical protein
VKGIGLLALRSCSEFGKTELEAELGVEHGHAKQEHAGMPESSSVPEVLASGLKRSPST